MHASTDRPFQLDAPLPVELAGRRQGWFTRYRRYPVFSRPWMLGRLKVLGPVVALVFVALMMPPVLSTRSLDMPAPIGGLLQIGVDLLLPLVLGPWLAWKVRQRGLPPAQEWLGLLGAIATAVLLVLAFNEWGAEPLKQWVAEQSGTVDASGKRKRMAISIGVSVSGPDRAAPPLPDPATDLVAHLSTLLSMAGLSFVLAGGAGLWGWRRERQELQALSRERELAQAQAERREAELRLSVLAAQVEPHFLFNTLAGVRSAIATDPLRASEMVDRLVDYLRAAIPRLRSDGHVQATLGAQLDIVRAYLGLMAARMPRLKWSVEVPPDLLRARCPPLMLISLAENAVKHGVERKIGPAQIVVQAARGDDGRLQVTVLDDGPGFDGGGAGGGGLGLANIRERLQQLHPGCGELRLKARPEGGVAASLLLPLEFDDLQGP
ncbi:MAG: histidine kinase [Rubrivivax sp.]